MVPQLASSEEEVATAHERSDKQETHKQNLQQLPHVIAVHYQRRYYRHNYHYREEERVACSRLVSQATPFAERGRSGHAATTELSPRNAIIACSG